MKFRLNKRYNFLQKAYNCNSLYSSWKFDSRKNLSQSVADINRCENSDNFEKLRECYFKNNQYDVSNFLSSRLFDILIWKSSKAQLHSPSNCNFNRTNLHFALRSTRTAYIFYVQSKIRLLVNIVAPGKIDYNANPSHRNFETQHTQSALSPYGRVCQDL